MDHQTMPDGTVFLKADPGEEILAGLLAFLNDRKIFAGIFQAVGAVREAEIGHFDPKGKKFNKAVVTGPLEILSLTGNVTRGEDGGSRVHAHVVLGDRDMRALGGHLFYGVAEPTCELVLRSFKGAVDVRSDPRYGLSLWSLSEK